MFKHVRKLSKCTSKPTWLIIPGAVLLRRNIHHYKYEPLVDEVTLSMHTWGCQMDEKSQFHKTFGPIWWTTRRFNWCRRRWKFTCHWWCRQFKTGVYNPRPSGEFCAAREAYFTKYNALWILKLESLDTIQLKENKFTARSKILNNYPKL